MHGNTKSLRSHFIVKDSRFSERLSIWLVRCLYGLHFCGHLCGLFRKWPLANANIMTIAQALPANWVVAFECPAAFNCLSRECLIFLRSAHHTHKCHFGKQGGIGIVIITVFGIKKFPKPSRGPRVQGCELGVRQCLGLCHLKGKVNWLGRTEGYLENWQPCFTGESGNRQ